MHCSSISQLFRPNNCSFMSIEPRDGALLGGVLQSNDYALGLSPGFFRFYAHMVCDPCRMRSAE